MSPDHVQPGDGLRSTRLFGSRIYGLGVMALGAVCLAWGAALAACLTRLGQLAFGVCALGHIAAGAADSLASRKLDS